MDSLFWKCTRNESIYKISKLSIYSLALVSSYVKFRKMLIPNGLYYVHSEVLNKKDAIEFNVLLYSPVPFYNIVSFIYKR